MKYKSNYESVQNCTGTELVKNPASPLEIPEFAKIPKIPEIPEILEVNGDSKKSVSRKTCTCSSGLLPCPSHGTTARSSRTNIPKIDLKKNASPIEIAENITDAEELSSRTFTIEPSVNSNYNELRLSLTSLISKDATVDEKQESVAFEKWLLEKKRQERQIRQRESHLQLLMEQERQKKIQMEQENFLNWLHAKKLKEKREREAKKKALEEEQRKKKEKLRREELNKKQYQLWLKLKEEQDLVKKINEQKRRIEKEERERQRLARNQSAFQDWLITSKDKPKPVPLNRGLESLRTSISVSFVNPDPWVPNIVENTKTKSKSK